MHPLGRGEESMIDSYVFNGFPTSLIVVGPRPTPDERPERYVPVLAVDLVLIRGAAPIAMLPGALIIRADIEAEPGRCL